MLLVSLLLGLLVVLVGVLAALLTQVRRRIEVEFADLRSEIVALRCNHDAHDQELAWRTSLLSLLSFADAAALAWLPSSAVVSRQEQDGRTVLLKAPQLSEAGDKIELVVEIIDEAHKALSEPTVAAIQIDIATTLISPATPAASESITTAITIHTEHSTQTIDLLSRMPEFMAKLPELVMSCLTPLAHYLSGLDTARKLTAANQKLDFLIRGRAIDQMAKLERIWTRAQETIKSGRPDRPALARLVWYRDELLELRLTWIGEMTFLLTNAPNVLAALLEKRASREFCKYVFPIPEKAKLLQIALFTDYCIALSTNTVSGFHRSLRQEVQRVEHLSAEFRRREATLRGDEARAHGKRIGDVLEAYRDFLTAMTNGPLPKPV
jgi:hypothetical protein